MLYLLLVWAHCWCLRTDTASRYRLAFYPALQWAILQLIRNHTWWEKLRKKGATTSLNPNHTSGSPSVHEQHQKLVPRPSLWQTRLWNCLTLLVVGSFPGAHPASQYNHPWESCSGLCWSTRLVCCLEGELPVLWKPKLPDTAGLQESDMMTNVCARIEIDQ